MYSQTMMDAVDRAEKLLVESHDPVAKICRTVADGLEAEHGYMASFRIKEAFKAKHGMGMAKYRETHTGIKNGEIVKEHNNEIKALRVEAAKRLLANTNLKIADVGRLSGLGHSTISSVFKRMGQPTPKQYRLVHREQTSTYTQQKATRKRIHLHGDTHWRLYRRHDDTSIARTNITEHLPWDTAVLTLTVQSLSFNIGGFVTPQRVTTPSAILIKTPFLTEGSDVVVVGTIPATLLDGTPYPITVRYNVVSQDVEFKIKEHIIDRIEATLQLTTTDL